MNNDHRKYFIVKHGLDSLEALPAFIWRTGKEPDDMPRGYDKVGVGDQWIAFAFKDRDEQTRTLSHVTGFYECIATAQYRDIPPQALEISDEETKAWMIGGKRVDKALPEHVFIPGIEKVLREADLLSKKLVPRVSIAEISRKQFEAIRRYVLDHIGDSKNIPLGGQ